jgi:hypothetical protein
MSIEICVLSKTRLEAISDWQQAINAELFPLRLSYGKSLRELDGFLPSYLQDQKTGFDCHHVEPHELFGTYPEVPFGHEWKYAIVFVWGGNFKEMRAAWMAATAYARATSGIIFDPQAGQLFTASQAFEIVQDNERVLPQLEAEMQKTRTNANGTG